MSAVALCQDPHVSIYLPKAFVEEYVVFPASGKVGRGEDHCAPHHWVLLLALPDVFINHFLPFRLLQRGAYIEFLSY